MSTTPGETGNGEGYAVNPEYSSKELIAPAPLLAKPRADVVEVEADSTSETTNSLDKELAVMGWV